MRRPTGAIQATRQSVAVESFFMRTTLAAVNQALAQRGYSARLAKASGYFYFHFGEAAGWLNRSVQGERISERSVEQWLEEFARLRTLNQKLGGQPREKVKRAGPRRRATKP
jgi:hypothetical protein